MSIKFTNHFKLANKHIKGMWYGYIVIIQIKKYLTDWFKTASSFIPWIGSIYIFYWLDSNIWSSETEHRGKLSVLIMLLGMYASLHVWNYFRDDK